MGVRKNGITLVDDVGGGGIAVDATIVAPLPLPVTSAFTTLLQTKNFPADSPVTLDVSELSSLSIQMVHNSGFLTNPTVEATLDGTNWILPIVNYYDEASVQYSAFLGIITYGLNYINVVDILQLRITAGPGGNETLTIYGTNVIHPESVKQTRISSVGNITADVGLNAPLSGDAGLFVRQVGISDMAALADDTINPSLGGIQSFPMVYDGVTWDRLRGDSTGLLVQGLSSITLSDFLGNPTTPALGSYGLLWNSVNWVRQPGNATDGATVNLGTNNDVRITDDGVDIAALTSDFELIANPKTLMIGGWDRVQQRGYPLPILASNFAAPTINDLAIPVDLRVTSALQNGASPRNNFILVGGRSNVSSPTGQQLTFSGEQLSGIDPTVTMGEVTREYGQQFVNSGNISLVGQRFTISSRYVVKAVAIFNLAEGNPFLGKIRPVVSIDNGTTWSYCLALNIETGANFSELETGEINGSYVIPAGNGATNFGFEVTERLTGDITFRVSANTVGIGALFAMTSPIGDTPISALVSDTPSSYIPDSTQMLSLTSEGRLRVSSVDSTIEKVWSTFDNNPWNLPSTVDSISAWR